MKVLHGVASECVRVQASEMEGLPRSGAEFFKINGVNHKGEEDMTAQVMQSKMKYQLCDLRWKACF